MPGRIPVLTPELADYIHARVANIGEEALKISPTSAKEDGSEKKRKRVFSIAWKLLPNDRIGWGLKIPVDAAEKR